MLLLHARGVTQEGNGGISPHFVRTGDIMPISIEQFRSRIGSHDNFVKTKDFLARLKDRF